MSKVPHSFLFLYSLAFTSRLRTSLERVRVEGFSSTSGRDRAWIEVKVHRGWTKLCSLTVISTLSIFSVFFLNPSLSFLLFQLICTSRPKHRASRGFEPRELTKGWVHTAPPEKGHSKGSGVTQKKFFKIIFLLFFFLFIF